MSASRAKKSGKVTVYDQKGRMAGEIHLPQEIFHARVEPRLLTQVRNMYAANLRSGTADTKTRRDVRGGGKKPWKQKGTGRARAGSIRSPLWRGGGTIFGPHPKDYYAHIPVQLRRQALIAALSLKTKDGKLTLVDSIELGAPKTREWAEIMKALKLDQERTLCVLGKPNSTDRRAARNLSYCFHLEAAGDLSAYEVMNHERLMLDRSAITQLESRLLGVGSRGESKEGTKREVSDALQEKGTT